MPVTRYVLGGYLERQKKRKLPEMWPGRSKYSTLVNRTVPLLESGRTPPYFTIPQSACETDSMLVTQRLPDCCSFFTKTSQNLEQYGGQGPCFLTGVCQQRLGFMDDGFEY
jgi:hypothetical protein